MIIKTLVEDTSCSPLLKHEHGFSIYIETIHNKILFDLGASDLFLENARKMNVNIKDVDFAFISHGHYDHGGGLKTFLQENDKATVYLHRKAFEKHFSQKHENISEIGIDSALMKNERIVLTDDIFPVNEELLLFSKVTGKEFFSSCNQTILAKQGNSYIQDDFTHEQNLIIHEDGKTVLIAGCAHRGIVNILKSMVVINDKMPDYVIGGFHLYNYGAKKSEDSAVVGQIGEYLKHTNAKYYTGHCTGSEPFQQLKSILGEKIQYLATGAVVNI